MRYEYYKVDNKEKLIRIWNRSINATHDFLNEEDKKFLEAELVKYLNTIDILELYHDNDLIGFAGLTPDILELLFLDPNYIGKGIGSRSMSLILESFNIKFIDVNEQNTRAKNFYLRHGFEITSRSEMDGYGLDYPILHLTKKR